MFVPNFKLLGPVIPEKYLMEKSLYPHKQTTIHCYGRDKNYIPLYFMLGVNWGNKKNTRVQLFETNDVIS